MALPYEGDTELGNDGAVNEIRPLTGVRRTSTAQDEYEFDDEEEPKGCWGRTQKSCNDFFLMICPSCVTSIPSIILIILAILIVSFVILSIPLVFALTYSHSSQHLGEQPDMNVPHLRNGDDDYFWPGVGRNGTNDTDYDYGLMDDSDNNTIPRIEELLPKNVSLCRGFGFVCASDPNFVIGTYARCDGVAQCPDGSDEINCNECQTSFSCPAKNNPNKLSCFRSILLCDGNTDCEDGSDEKLCSSKTCASDQFQCSQMCLPKSFVCDGESHCSNGADESNCNGKCKNGSKWCAVTNQCLPKWKLCDGMQDCPDGSDEAGCDCKSCSGKGRMLCKPDGNENDGFCVRQDKICDGNKDCPNNVDEAGCPSRNDILFGVMRKSLKFL